MGQRRPLVDLVRAILSLVSESEGVVGLHRNGDVAAWEDLLPGGRYETWLGEALASAQKVLSWTPETRPTREYPLASGYTLYRQPNDVGGYQYWSDEIGGGVLVWDTCLVDDRSLRAALAVEEQHGLAEQPFKAIPYHKLLCNGQYLCFDPRRPGYVVGMWTDRWIMLNHEMVFDAKVQRAARDCLVPCLLLPSGEPDV